MKKSVLFFMIMLPVLVMAQAPKKPLFNKDLSDAEFPAGVWTITGGVITAGEDQCIWTKRDYQNFILDLEFKNAEGTNSGVILYCTDTKNWIPNSIEVQIADDYAKRWAESIKSWQCGAIFNHLPASKSVVRKPGEWNRMTITCMGKNITVKLNGEVVTEMNMDLWTNASVNPDGTEIPTWLKTVPLSTLRTSGRIGFQGKHAGAPVWFRNIKIKELR